MVNFIQAIDIPVVKGPGLLFDSSIKIITDEMENRANATLVFSMSSNTNTDPKDNLGSTANTVQIVGNVSDNSTVN